MKKPLVYACAGCSNAGETAYRVARELDRRGIAEMSCLAGVGAGHKHFLRQLHDRILWVIDGCPIACGKGIFAEVPQDVDLHLRLQDFGIRKEFAVPEGAALERLVDRVFDAAERNAHASRADEVT